MAGFQERPAARRVDGPTLSEVHRLYRTLAERNTVVIGQELARQGIHVDLRTLQRAVAPLRREERAKALATVRFETEPGQQMQVDFGEKVVQIAGEPVKVYLMTAVLGYSRRLYCRAFLAQRQDDWLEGLEEALRHFRGLPRQILCDNASPLVVSHDRRTGEVVWNAGFEVFCRDRGLSAKACRPRRARTKGKIERGVGYVKHNALAGRSFDSFGELLRHLSKWMVEVADERIQGTTREKPSVRFQRDERQALRPLPRRPLLVRTRRLTRRVSADCFVDIDTIRYSVPHRHVREAVEVVVKDEHVEVWLRGQRIARHVRRHEPHAWVRDPAHFEGLFRSETVSPSPAPARELPLPHHPAACHLRRARRRRPAMDTLIDPQEERIFSTLTQLKLTRLRETLPAVLSEAAKEWTYLEFLDRILQREVDAKQAKRVRMVLQITHFFCVRAIEDFDFSFQPSVDERLVRELATGNFIANGDNVLIFGPPGVGKTHLAIGLGRKIVEEGHTARFTTATALLATLGKAESERNLPEKLTEYCKPRLLIIDELGYFPFERRAAHLFFQLVNRRYEKGSLLVTTNQQVSDWGTVFGDEVLATTILDRLLHHSHTLIITGDSYRLREKRKSGLIRSRLANAHAELSRRGTEVKIPKDSDRDRDKR
jgi:DNA replication protein DnaC/transposase